jgi:hypothetical protein
METLTRKLAIIVRHNQAQAIDVEDNGEVAERLNAPVLKTGVGAIRPWVRIPPSPPAKIGKFAQVGMASKAPKIAQVALQVALILKGEYSRAHTRDYVRK